ncbi:MAG TPA: DUF6089 family protein [Bacteroidia bacterium]|nr:DUF6089 family protein [Bacteroidia bacterium]
MRKATPFVKTALLASSLFLLPFIAHAQYYWDIGISTGASNYLGDMGGKQLTRRDFVSDMKMSQTHMTTTGLVRYKVNPFFSVKADIGWARISGDDRLSSNPGRNGRNLSFRNDLFEAAAQAQFCFYEINDLGRTFKHKNSFRAYVGLGAGMVYNNPKALYNGNYVALRPLMTEGKRYTAVTGIIPASMGFYFTMNKQWRIGWDFTWRTTFTDYLDDVSTVYADPSTLSSATAAALANRTHEKTNIDPAFAENFTPGSKRGDPTHNDSYLTTSIDLSYVMRTKSDWEKQHATWLHNRPGKFDNDHRYQQILWWHVKRKVRIVF